MLNLKTFDKTLPEGFKLGDPILDPQPRRLDFLQDVIITICPRCKLDVMDQLEQCDDGNSRSCPHCHSSFHYCATGKFVFRGPGPFECQNCGSAAE